MVQQIDLHNRVAALESAIGTMFLEGPLVDVDPNALTGTVEAITAYDADGNAVATQDIVGTLLSPVYNTDTVMWWAPQIRVDGDASRPGEWCLVVTVPTTRRSFIITGVRQRPAENSNVIVNEMLQRAFPQLSTTAGDIRPGIFIGVHTADDIYRDAVVAATTDGPTSAIRISPETMTTVAPMNNPGTGGGGYVVGNNYETPLMVVNPTTLKYDNTGDQNPFGIFSSDDKGDTIDIVGTDGRIPLSSNYLVNQLSNVEITGSAGVTNVRLEPTFSPSVRNYRFFVTGTAGVVSVTATATETGMLRGMPLGPSLAREIMGADVPVGITSGTAFHMQLADIDIGFTVNVVSRSRLANQYRFYFRQELT